MEPVANISHKQKTALWPSFICRGAGNRNLQFQYTFWLFCSLAPKYLKSFSIPATKRKKPRKTWTLFILSGSRIVLTVTKFIYFLSVINEQVPRDTPHLLVNSHRSGVRFPT